jgi:hypothetical protein
LNFFFFMRIICQSVCEGAQTSRLCGQ